MTVQLNVKREYDLLFIGTIHSDRHRILKQIKEICLKQNLTYFYYMYLPSKILFYLRSLVDPSLWRSKLSDFSFSALKKTDIIGLVEKCRAVIDIQHPKQIGLTIRTMEVLGARRKLLSTNRDIVNYEVYAPANIQILDRKNIDIDPSFLKTEMSALNDEIFNKYSIDGWISDIFSLSKESRSGQGQCSQYGFIIFVKIIGKMAKLITGGSGFIGSHFHKVLDTEDLVNLDLNEPSFSHRSLFIKGDIRIERI